MVVSIYSSDILSRKEDHLCLIFRGKKFETIQNLSGQESP